MEYRNPYDGSLHTLYTDNTQPRDHDDDLPHQQDEDEEEERSSGGHFMSYYFRRWRRNVHDKQLEWKQRVLGTAIRVHFSLLRSVHKWARQTQRKKLLIQVRPVFFPFNTPQRLW